MSGDRSAEFRASAADCLKLARRAGDPRIRAALLVMPQRWLDLADEPLGARRFQSLLEDFNSQQSGSPSTGDAKTATGRAGNGVRQSIQHRLKSWLKQLSRCSYGRRGFSHRSFAVSAYGNVVGDPNFRPLSRLMARRASRAADKSHGSHWLRPYDILTHPVGALATQNAAALRLKQRVEADIRNPAGT